MSGASIEISGGWAILAVIVFVVVGSIGFAGVLLIAYRVWDYTIRQTLIFFKLHGAFTAFLFDHLSKKRKHIRIRPEGSDSTE